MDKLPATNHVWYVVTRQQLPFCLENSKMAKNQEGRPTWMMWEAFQVVSPCRTTTTSVNSSSPLGGAAGVGDMARWVAVAPASLSSCRSRSREGGYPPDIPSAFMAAWRKKPPRWRLLQPDVASIVGCCGGTCFRSLRSGSTSGNWHCFRSSSYRGCWSPN